MNEPAISQIAIGSNIAQAAEGATAIVATYSVTPAPPPDADSVAESLALVSQIPTQTVPEPSALPNRSRMSLSRNDLFTGRMDQLMWAARLLGSSFKQVPTVGFVGLGGVGKSQTASEYVHRYGSFYAGGVYWMNFADPATITNEVAACGGTEGMDLRADFRVLSPDQQVDLVRSAWLSPMPRLLVFDNCEDEETLARWRPTSGACRVLMTSRRTTWDATLGIELCELDVLTAADGGSLLSRYRSATSPLEHETLARISEQLGHLPLALHLAGSYLRRFQAVVSGASYLQQLQESPVIEHRSLTASGISPTQHVQSIAATFALSVDALADDSTDALARRCLAHTAYLAPGEPIPRTLLLWSLELSASPDAALDLDEAVRRLGDLGLTQLTADGAPRLHRLVAAFVEDRLGDDEKLAEVELGVLKLLFPRWQVDTGRARAAYEPHLRVLTERALSRDDTRAADLGNLLGLYLWARQNRDGAINYLRQALDIRERLHGVDAPGTARDLNDLGFVHLGGSERLQGKPFLERALRLWDPETEAMNLSATLDNLGQLHLDLSQPEVAKLYLIKALDIRVHQLGEDAWPTSVTLQNLANIDHMTGDLSAAIATMQRVVDIRESLVESPLSSTARSHRQLALYLSQDNDPLAARRHSERAMELFQQDLGPTHPRTLTVGAEAVAYALQGGDRAGVARLIEITALIEDGLLRADFLASLSGVTANNLGFAFWLSGRYATAQQLYEAALDQGESEPTALNNLGMISERLGEYPAAVARYREALASLHEVQSPLRARVLNNLGVSLALGGDPSTAGRILQEALELRREILGEQAPDYAVTLGNLALVAERENRLPDAQALAEQALGLLARTGGAEHARALRRLGTILARRGDPSSLNVLRAAVQTYGAALGADHPDVAMTRRTLAIALADAGREDEARDVAGQAAPVLESCLGSDHPWMGDIRTILSR